MFQNLSPEAAEVVNKLEEISEGLQFLEYQELSEVWGDKTREIINNYINQFQFLHDTIKDLLQTGLKPADQKNSQDFDFHLNRFLKIVTQVKPRIQELLTELDITIEQKHPVQVKELKVFASSLVNQLDDLLARLQFSVALRKYLKYFKEELKITQNKFAEFIGEDAPWLSRVLNCSTGLPKEEKIIQIATALRVPPHELSEQYYSGMMLPNPSNNRLDELINIINDLDIIQLNEVIKAAIKIKQQGRTRFEPEIENPPLTIQR